MRHFEELEELIPSLNGKEKLGTNKSGSRSERHLEYSEKRLKDEFLDNMLSTNVSALVLAIALSIFIPFILRSNQISGSWVLSPVCVSHLKKR